MENYDDNNAPRKEAKGFAKWLLRNVLAAAALVLCLVLLAQVGLGLFTKHGKEIEVPDMTGMSMDEATYNASLSGLRLEVTDSVFIRRMARGTVYSQNPIAGSKVKAGRKIRLTINAVQPKKLSMPNLVGLSMRQANAELNSRGLSLGKLIYVSDMATNNVLRQLYRNVEIKPGRQIESGAEIDLVVGLNPDDNQTYVPNLTGLKFRRALDVLHENGMNVRRVVFDDGVRTYADSLNAVVYKQVPAASPAPILMGSDISLWLTLDPMTAK